MSAAAKAIARHMLVKSCEATGLLPAGDAAAKIVGKVADARRREAKLALSLAGHRLQIAGREAYYADCRSDADSDERFRDALAAFDAAHEIVRGFAP